MDSFGKSLRCQRKDSSKHPFQRAACLEIGISDQAITMRLIVLKAAKAGKAWDLSISRGVSLLPSWLGALIDARGTSIAVSTLSGGTNQVSLSTTSAPEPTSSPEVAVPGRQPLDQIALVLAFRASRSKPQLLTTFVRSSCKSIAPGKPS